MQEETLVVGSGGGGGGDDDEESTTYFFDNDDDILLFEILVRKIKMELNKIMRENDRKKSNLESCNSKKDLVTRYLNADDYGERELLKSEIVREKTMTLNSYLTLNFLEIFVSLKGGIRNTQIPKFF